MSSPATLLLDGLKAKHRAMWASGDYPSMVETFLLPLGPELVDAAEITPGTRVLDVAAGTGNASVVAAQRGADVVASDLVPELLEAGQRRADAAGVALDWIQADAEALPFDDDSFDVVMSAIGVMFAPYHQVAAGEHVRVAQPGGRIALLSWTPDGMLGALFRMMGQFAPAPPPGAQPPPLWGGEAALERPVRRPPAGHAPVSRRARRHRVRAAHRLRAALQGSLRPHDPIRANAAKNGLADEFDAALDALCAEWNRGSDDQARFEMEYLVTVGTVAG